MPIDLSPPDQFPARHIGPRPDDVAEMLRVLGVPSLDKLIDDVVPAEIRLRRALQLPPAVTELELLEELHALGAQNQIWKSFIGMGYSDCITPPVIQRNILENPGWYTQYTPYQAEISQGRLEALLNFQTMIADLTGLPIANASLLDEATAAAEAMTMLHAVAPAAAADEPAQTFFVSDALPSADHRRRAHARGAAGHRGRRRRRRDVRLRARRRLRRAACSTRRPTARSATPRGLCARAHAAGALVVVATDLLALTVLTPPGEFGADVAVGSAQRFGVPLGYGGPHAAFFVDEGRVGAQDAGPHHRRLAGRARPDGAAHGAADARAAHPPREGDEQHLHGAGAAGGRRQHVRRLPRAQGPARDRRARRRAAPRCWRAGSARLGDHGRARARSSTPCASRAAPPTSPPGSRAAEARRINLRRLDARASASSLDETTRAEDVQALWEVFAEAGSGDASRASPWPSSRARSPTATP